MNPNLYVAMKDWYKLKPELFKKTGILP